MSLKLLILVVVFVGWFLCGWLGGRIMKRDWRKEFGKWTPGDEAIARGMMVFGAFTLISVALMHWFTKHPASPKGSWFGK